MKIKTIQIIDIWQKNIEIESAQNVENKFQIPIQFTIIRTERVIKSKKSTNRPSNQKIKLLQIIPFSFSQKIKTGEQLLKHLSKIEVSFNIFVTNMKVTGGYFHLCRDLFLCLVYCLIHSWKKEKIKTLKSNSKIAKKRKKDRIEFERINLLVNKSNNDLTRRENIYDDDGNNNDDVTTCGFELCRRGNNSHRKKVFK